MMTTRIIQIAHEAGVTQAELGRAVGMSASQISRKLTGKRGLRLDEAWRIAAYLSSRTGKAVRIDDWFRRGSSHPADESDPEFQFLAAKSV